MKGTITENLNIFCDEPFIFSDEKAEGRAGIIKVAR